jgi:hypothetical protein
LRLLLLLLALLLLLLLAEPHQDARQVIQVTRLRPERIQQEQVG